MNEATVLAEGQLNSWGYRRDSPPPPEGPEVIAGTVHLLQGSRESSMQKKTAKSLRKSFYRNRKGKRAFLTDVQNN